jgi:hypothetical protein
MNRSEQGLRFHGDTVAGRGQLDFAVNVVPGGPPGWLLEALRDGLSRAAAYPDQGPATTAVVDNGSSHRGQASIDRLEGQWPNLRLVHLPIHASWLNQEEIYFSVIQRKVLSPNDFTDLGEVEQRLLGFQRRYQQTAVPFDWRTPRPTSTNSSRGWTSTSTLEPRHDHHARTSIRHY